jgi:heme-degrading monooxygenase HmoA
MNEKFCMTAVSNRLPVKEGMANQGVERFSNSRGYVQHFPGFVSMEVLRSKGADEVKVITHWQDKDVFDLGSIAMSSRQLMVGAVVVDCCEDIRKWAPSRSL